VGNKELMKILLGLIILGLVLGYGSLCFIYRSLVKFRITKYDELEIGKIGKPWGW